nr:16S rRNA (cytidine(1402)-2'-O)-methyltransferase [Pararhodospirillum photometricum]
MTDRDLDGQPTDPPAQSPLAPGLYVVGTPIGNMGDITARARDILARADVVACEDTRVTGGLLHRLGIATRLTPYHEHNAEAARPLLLGRLQAGEAVALVSDAGMPLVSDPGYKLVRACHEAGIRVSAAPGPSAVLTALALAGLPTDRFFFAGFPPSKPGKLASFLRRVGPPSGHFGVVRGGVAPRSHLGRPGRGPGPARRRRVPRTDQAP